MPSLSLDVLPTGPSAASAEEVSPHSPSHSGFDEFTQAPTSC